LSFAEQAMAKVLPTGAQSALSHAGQIGSALPALGHLTQGGLGAFAVPKLG
jgi:hypothetical protein